MRSGWYKSKPVTILTNIAVWAVVLSLPYLLDTHHGMHHHDDNDANGRAFFYMNLVTSMLWVVPFYLNVYWFTPRLFYQRRYMIYILALVLAFGFVLLAHFSIYNYVLSLPHFSVRGALGFLIPPFILTVAIGTTYRVVRDKMEADQHIQDKHEENLKTELSFLRSQINPHFIFNVLNNLVALEQMKSDELGPTILKLSSLMQYMLYETDEDRVPLAKEAEYLQSYIGLQRQRFGEKVPISVSIQAPAEQFEIEPMLLIPFVENAFKHGVGIIENPAIEIMLEVKGRLLHFTVRNRYDSSSVEIRDNTSGIGLGNVKRRLELLYGAEQQLNILREEEWFLVDLKLNLH